MVALRKESVDRNKGTFIDRDSNFASLSARRAWIEITTLQGAFSCPLVALRKESVDRNQVAVHFDTLSAVALRKESVDRNLWWGVRKAVGSLVALRKESVDRNLLMCTIKPMPLIVALRKESVDRNYIIKITGIWGAGRSPQGERG